MRIRFQSSAAGKVERTRFVWAEVPDLGKSQTWYHWYGFGEEGTLSDETHTGLDASQSDAASRAKILAGIGNRDLEHRVDDMPARG
jgi:hypothetical protein